MGKKPTLEVQARLLTTGELNRSSTHEGVMHSLGDAQRKENKYERTNCLSKLFGWHLSDFLRDGAERNLSCSDVYKIDAKHSSNFVATILEREWGINIVRHEEGIKPTSLLDILSKCIKWRIVLSVFSSVFQEALKFGSAVLLLYLLMSIENGDYKHLYTGCYYAAGVAGCILLLWLVKHPTDMCMRRASLDVQVSVSALLYKKILRMRSGMLKMLSTNRISEMISHDTQELQMVFVDIGCLASAPLLTIGTVVWLWFQVGYACFVTLILVIICLLIQLWIRRCHSKIWLHVDQLRDTRMRLMSDFVTHAHSVKACNLTDIYREQINAARSAESSMLMRFSLTSALNLVVTTIFVPSLLLITFGVYHILENKVGPMSVSLVASTFVLAVNLYYGVIKRFPEALHRFLKAETVCEKLEDFLISDEIVTLDTKKASCQSKLASISFDNVSAVWCKDRHQRTAPLAVRRVSFRADKENDFVIVTGPSGIGKSAILRAALGDLFVTAGKVDITGNVAYSPQEPWIFTGSIQENILFGRKFEHERYDEVVDACALLEDFEMLPRGDQTLVQGDGAGLSASMKAKISLARAAYKDADVYLLDDPLSMLDGPIGRHVFEQCIRGVLQRKIVVLVTSQIQYFQHATCIICLTQPASGGDGPAVLDGTLVSLTRQGVDFVSLIHPKASRKLTDRDSAIDTDDSHGLYKNAERSLTGIRLIEETDELKVRNKRGRVNKSFSDSEFLEENLSNNSSEVDEDQSYIDASLFEYLTQGVGTCGTIILFLLILITQVISTGADWWLCNWAYGEYMASKTITPQLSTSLPPFYQNATRADNLYIYIGFIGVSIVFHLLRCMLMFVAMTKGGRELHQMMLNGLLEAPIDFIDDKMDGEILSCFSDDMQLLDERLPLAAFYFLTVPMQLLAIGAVSIACVPYMAIIATLLIVVFIFWRRNYMFTERQVTRMASNASVPLEEHLSATVAGLSTIQAFSVQSDATREYHMCLDHQSEHRHQIVMVTTWFAQRTHLIACVFVICTLFAPQVVLGHLDVSPVLAGLSMSYALLLMCFIERKADERFNLTNQMLSMERASEYANLEPEADAGVNEKLPDDWPRYGLITAESASFAYSPAFPYVLKKIFFCIRANEKIGIVGKSGSGKTALLNMMFRIGHTTGTVRIDGYPINNLKLETLRNTLAFVPSDPVLVNGNLRSNIDIHKKFEDADIWHVLEEVYMKEEIMALPAKLNTDVSCLSHLNVGHRQLLYLARALLQENPFIVLEESNKLNDLETDAVIQQTVREKFKTCTVLMVASRLSTIMDMERVMVLENGKIVAFDEPYQLLKDPDGLFRLLVDEAGRVEAKRLELLAEEATELRRAMLIQNQLAYPGCNIKSSKTRSEIIDYFQGSEGPTTVWFESTV